MWGVKRYLFWRRKKIVLHNFGKLCSNEVIICEAMSRGMFYTYRLFFSLANNCKDIISVVLFCESAHKMLSIFNRCVNAQHYWVDVCTSYTLTLFNAVANDNNTQHYHGTQNLKFIFKNCSAHTNYTKQWHSAQSLPTCLDVCYHCDVNTETASFSSYWGKEELSMCHCIALLHNMNT